MGRVTLPALPSLSAGALMRRTTRATAVKARLREPWECGRKQPRSCTLRNPAEREPASRLREVSSEPIGYDAAEVLGNPACHQGL